MSHSKDLVKDRFFMEGVSEQHVIGMAAGMALEGYLPYVNTISTFLTRRCFEQIVVDLCLQNLPVKLIGNGGGISLRTSWTYPSSYRRYFYFENHTKHDHHSSV